MEILEILKSDTEYYSGAGKNYLSNSDISTLLNDPASFGKPKEKTLAMLQGSYFHTAILEPEKLKNFQIVEASTRSTKIYQEAVLEAQADMLLLKKEVDELESMAQSLMSNITFFDMIRDPGNRYEVPSVGVIGGLDWKGKADIVGNDLIIDLKTTSKLDDFKYSARKYNYDSQAFIYSQLFGLPMVFIVVEKETNRLGFFDCSDEFLEYGRQKVIRAIEVYERFFGPNATADVDQYYLAGTL